MTPVRELICVFLFVSLSLSQDVVLQCPKDVQINHGQLVLPMPSEHIHRVPESTTATVICDPGYFWEDSQVKSVVCGPFGAWMTQPEKSKNLNLCSRNGCPPPPEVPHAVPHMLSSSLAQGMQVEYVCSAGYKLLTPDDTTLTCHNYEWNGPTPECVLRRFCDAPADITHGYWSPQEKRTANDYAKDRSSVGYTKFDEGSKIVYKCSPGYKLVGTRILKCIGQQTWSTIPPECVPRNEHIWYCPVLKPIKNGFCKCANQDTTDLQRCQPFHRDTRIECSCLPGYALQGVSVLTCTQGTTRGVWDWSVPSCIKRFVPETDIDMLPDNRQSPGSKKDYNSGDIHDSKSKVSSLVIVVTTACSVLGILILIMVVVIFRRKKPRATIFHQGSTPPPYARVHSAAMDELDRLALMAYADASRIHLPSYEESMRPGSIVGTGVRGPSGLDRSVSPTSSEYQRLPNVLVRSNNHHNSLAGDGNNNINNNNNNNANRHSIVTTSTMNRDGLSEIFGSVDTVNVSMSDASTALTIETFDSGTSNRSMVSQRANAGSLNSSEDHLANEEDAPLLETSSQREVDVVSLGSNPSRTSKED